MKKKRKYVIFIVIVFIYLIFTGILYLNNKRNKLYIVVRNDIVWVYQNKELKSLNNKNKKTLNWTKFKVYSDGKKIGRYSLWYDNKWYVFKDNNDPVNYDGELFAYKSQKNIKALSYKNEEVKDNQYIDFLLKKNNIINDNNYNVKNYINVDIDSDGEKEDFYLVSNAFKENIVSKKYYAFAFMVKNNKIYTIYSDVTKDTYDGCIPAIDAFIDIDSDDKYEVVFTCSKYSIQKSINKVYRFKDKNFEEIIYR